jgi:hypothetical protein
MNVKNVLFALFTLVCLVNLVLMPWAIWDMLKHSQTGFWLWASLVAWVSSIMWIVELAVKLFTNKK